MSSALFRLDFIKQKVPTDCQGLLVFISAFLCMASENHLAQVYTYEYQDCATQGTPRFPYVKFLLHCVGILAKCRNRLKPAAWYISVNSEILIVGGNQIVLI